MNLKTLVGAALAIAIVAGAARAEDPPLKDDEKWVEATEAPEETVKDLLEKHRKAVDAKEAEPLCAVLKEMSVYNNARFEDPAQKALKYRAGTADKKAAYQIAKERGITKPKYIQAMIAESEERVQAVAARMLANFPGNETTKLLHRTFMDKKIRDDKPLLTKEVIISMARLGYTKLWDEIESEFRKFGDKEIMRAAVIYFGLTREKRVAKMLCDHIDEPSPGNVNSPTNPPAAYWKVRWDAWDNIKNVVQWALKEITGYEGEFHSSKQARDYINDHERELGIR